MTPFSVTITTRSLVEATRLWGLAVYPYLNLW
jgi:hypothetical protein